jgi:hypothetical protein
MERTPSLLQLGRSTSHVLQQQVPLILRLPESFSWPFRNQIKRTLCPHRHTHADFVGTLAHRIGNDAVN